MKFQPGDRVRRVGTGKKGTVIKPDFSTLIKRTEVCVNWDHIKYNNEFDYSTIDKNLVYKISKLEKALE